MNCFNRAYICASTAISAYIRVNYVNITFRNSVYGAFIDAAATSSAIFINYISHLFDLFLVSKIDLFRHKDNVFLKNSHLFSRLSVI